MNELQQSSRRRGWQLRFALCIGCLVGAPLAHAQLTNCANVNQNPADYKIVLDEFSFTSATAQANPDLAALQQRLQFNFNGQLDRLKMSARKLREDLHVPLILVYCGGRRPSVNGTEFTDTLAKSLSDRKVVVEVWGTLDLRSSPGQLAKPSAMIGYVMPPVQHYATEANAPPKYVLLYPKTGNAISGEELEDLPELAAFALVGLGTKARLAKKYDLAAWAFTRAEAGLLDAQQAGGSQLLESLLAYVKRAACLTHAKAYADDQYTGSLKVVPPKSCAGLP